MIYAPGAGVVSAMDTIVETKEERVARRRLEITGGKHPFGEDRTKHDMMENLRMTSGQRVGLVVTLACIFLDKAHGITTRSQRAAGRIERRPR